MLRAHILVRGLVHGVGFRSFVKRHAEMLGLKGFVRNVSEGVEVVVEGDNNLVRHLITKIREGPTISRVEDVEISFEDVKNEFEEFTIEP